MFRVSLPGVMDDIEPKKLTKAEYTRRSTRPLFMKKQ